MRTLLLWADPDDDGTTDALARRASLAPRWWEDDDPRAALLTSFAQARGESPGGGAGPRAADHRGQEVTLIGVGLGGTAAASLLLHQRRLGLSIGRGVLADVDWTAVDPISGSALPLPGPRPPDTVVDVVGDDDATLDVVRSWRDAGWFVTSHAAGTSVAEVAGDEG